MSGNRWLAGEFDYRDGIRREAEELSLADIYNNEHADLGGIHPQASMTKNMSGLQRMIYESADFAVNAGGVFQKVNPEELDGEFWDQCDLEEMKQRLQNNPAALEWLEKNGELYSQLLDEMDHETISVEPGTVTDEEGEEHVVNPQNFGYTNPKDKYRRTDAPTFRNYSKEAAERRVKRLNDLKDEVTKLHTIGACEAFLTELRPDYHHDRDIRNDWNESSRLVWREVFRAHLQSRQRKIDSLMLKKGKGLVSRDMVQFFEDMALWNCFDKQPMTRYLVSRGNVKFFKPEKPAKEWLEKYNFTCIEHGRTQGSWWDRYRSRAFQDLFLTMKQWNELYEAIFTRLKSLIERLSLSNEKADQKVAVEAAEKYSNRFGMKWLEEVRANAKAEEKNMECSNEGVVGRVNLEKVFHIASLRAKTTENGRPNSRVNFQYGVTVQWQNPNTKTFWARLVREGYLPASAIMWCWVDTVPGEPDFREWVGLRVCPNPFKPEEAVIIDLRKPDRRKLQVALEADLRKYFGIFGDGKTKARPQVARPVRPTTDEDSPF